MMRQLVTMRHPIAFILFGALVAVLALYPIRVVDVADVATSVEGENFDVKPTGTKVVTDTALYSNGQALKFSNNTAIAKETGTFSSEGDVVLIARADQKGGSPKLRVSVNGTFTAPAQAITNSGAPQPYTFDVNAPSGSVKIGVKASNMGTGRQPYLDYATFPASGGGGGTDTTPPETSITSGPSGSVTGTTATFEFTSNEPGSTFECRLYASGSPAPAFSNCASPYTTATLSDGNYVFEVRAKDAAGNVDATPASDSFTVNTVVTSNSPFPGIRYYSTMGVYEHSYQGFASEPSRLQDQYNTYVGSASENAYLDLDNDSTRYYFCGGRKYEWTDMLVDPVTAPASRAQAQDPNWSNYKWNQTDVVDQMLDNSTAAQQDKAKVCLFVATSATAQPDPVPTYVKNGTSYYGNGLTWTDGQGKVHVRLDKVGGQQAISDFLIALTKHYGNDPRIASITNGEWYTNSDAGGLPTGFNYSAFKTGQKAVWQAWVNSAPKDATGNRLTIIQSQPIVAGSEVSAADIQNIGIGISGSSQTVFRDSPIDAVRRILYGVVPLSHQVNAGTVGTNVTFDNTPNPFGYAAGSTHPATYPVIAWFYDNQGLIPNSNAKGSKVPLDSINMGADPTLVSQWHSAFDQFGPNGSKVPTWGQIPNIP
jgi:hypothetical protein